LKKASTDGGVGRPRPTPPSVDAFFNKPERPGHAPGDFPHFPPLAHSELSRRIAGVGCPPVRA